MTSVSTLFRRARATKDPKKAAKLRKEAATMRGTRKTRNPYRKAQKLLNKIRKRELDYMIPTEDDLRQGAMNIKLQELNEKHQDQLRAMREINQINVICAFMADMEGTAGLNGGVLPPSVMVSGFAVARLLEVLRTAGYSIEGKRGVNREEITKGST